MVLFRIRARDLCVMVLSNGVLRVVICYLMPLDEYLQKMGSRLPMGPKFQCNDLSPQGMLNKPFCRASIWLVFVVNPSHEGLLILLRMCASSYYGFVGLIKGVCHGLACPNPNWFLQFLKPHLSSSPLEIDRHRAIWKCAINNFYRRPII
jgi:hypothetical protein